jgi:hypothetical protein
MIDRKLLKGAKASLRKEAFTPLTPEAQAAAAGGGMPPPGGAPPMDPAMMGGMPPMDPAMMGGMPPMDPAMMGGAPPMDPAMMGGAPPPVDPATGMPIDPATGMPIDPATGMPMDPAMMGGAPPAEEGGDTVKVSMDDLKALMEEVVGSKNGEKPSRRATNAEILDKLTEIEGSLAALTGAPPPAEVGMMPPGMEEAGGAPMPPGSPEDISAMLQNTGMPVQASAKRSPIANLVKTLKEKQR